MKQVLNNGLTKTYVPLVTVVACGLFIGAAAMRWQADRSQLEATTELAQSNAEAIHALKAVDAAHLVTEAELKGAVQRVETEIDSNQREQLRRLDRIEKQLDRLLQEVKP